MKIKPIYVAPRSYREATGKHLNMRSSDHEPAWVPIVGGAVFGIVLAVLFFLGC